jgi:hypothetical protein
MIPSEISQEIGRAPGSELPPLSPVANGAQKTSLVEQAWMPCTHMADILTDCV